MCFSDNVHLAKQTDAFIAAMTLIRDKNCSREDFIFQTERLTRYLIEVALNLLAFVEKTVKTNKNDEFVGITALGQICGVSLLHAGEAMEPALREVCRSIRIGKLLIQRDLKTASLALIYEVLPQDISSRTVLLLVPTLATGGSAIKAIEVLMQHGVSEDKIIIVNLISCRIGLKKLHSTFPSVAVVTGAIDPELDESNFIVPGLGDFACRFFGTGKY